MIKYTLREILFWSESLPNLPTSNMTTKTLRSARRKLLPSVRFPDDAVDSVNRPKSTNPVAEGQQSRSEGRAQFDVVTNPEGRQQQQAIWCRILNG